MSEPVDSQLVGCWRLIAVRQIEGRLVTSIAGIPRELVEFTTGGLYRVDLKDPEPACYSYSTSAGGEPADLDIWITDAPSHRSRCIWEVEGAQLLVCVALNHGIRPTGFRQDDASLWALYSFERAKPPRPRKKKADPLVEPGSFIPTAFKKKS